VLPAGFVGGLRCIWFFFLGFGIVICFGLWLFVFWGCCVCLCRCFAWVFFLYIVWWRGVWGACGG